MFVDIIEVCDGSEVVQVYIMCQFQCYLIMCVFYKLMDYYLNEVEEGCVKESLMVLCDMVGEKVCSKFCYCCQKCGFIVYIFYWYCLFCWVWLIIKLICGFDGL